MQYVMLIYQGTTPTPTSESWATLTEDEQQQVYRDYHTLNSDPRASRRALPPRHPETPRPSGCGATRR